jgi:anti-sigma factor RsiW
MACADLEPIIEDVADGTLDLDADARAHLAACPLCARRLAMARGIHDLLITREAPAPPPTFTAGVMALVQKQRWQAERAIDLGFNLAVAAGILIIVAGGVGLAWSLGLLDVAVNLELLAEAGLRFTERIAPQIQTIGVAGLLLTMALGFWWWAEAGPSEDRRI